MQVYSNELCHYGVQGMKWGVRRYQNPDGSLTSRGRKRYGTEEHFNAKQSLKAANKQYNKDFNAAYNKRLRAWSPSKKERDKEDERWNKAMDSAAKWREAKANYKVARKEAKAVIKDDKLKAKEAKLARKENIKNTTNQLINDGKINKFVYNRATAKAAAKKILDKNMSVDEAVKKAKTQAWVNTAAIVAAYGGVTLYQLSKLHNSY